MYALVQRYKKEIVSRNIEESQKYMSDNFFTLNIDVKRFPALVIGGGQIAYRKIMNLLAFNADITCLSVDYCNEILQLISKNQIKYIKKQYAYGDGRDFRIIFAATGDLESDRLIRTECNESGALLNVADVPELCDFIMPSFVKRGKITISVSSEGSAPFYTKELRKKLELLISDEETVTAEMAAYFRNLLQKHQNYDDAKIREALINSFLKYNWYEILNTEGLDAAKKRVQDILEISYV